MHCKEMMQSSLPSFGRTSDIISLKLLFSRLGIEVEKSYNTIICIAPMNREKKLEYQVVRGLLIKVESLISIQHFPIPEHH